MKPLSSPLIRRILSISLLLLIIFFPIGLALNWVIPFLIEEQSTQETMNAIITRYQRVLAERPALEARMKELQTRQRGQAGLFSSASVPQASATLQAEIRRLVETNGGEVRSVQTGSLVADHGFQRIEASFDLSLPNLAIPPLLAGLDQHDPYIFPEKLEISVPETGSIGARAIIKLHVIAYWQSP